MCPVSHWIWTEDRKVEGCQLTYKEELRVMAAAVLVGSIPKTNSSTIQWLLKAV